MSNNPPVRPLRLPPPKFDEVKIPKTRQPARNWFRVHQNQCQALFFSLNAGHRFSHAACPFKILYVGVDVDTCLFERFGDTIYNAKHSVAKSLWNYHSVSKLTIPELKVCDLTNASTLSSLSVDLTSLMHPDLSISQAWGLAIQSHPAEFDGVKYKSRFNGKSCLALFDRKNLGKRIPERCLGELTQEASAADWLAKHDISLY